MSSQAKVVGTGSTPSRPIVLELSPREREELIQEHPVVTRGFETPTPPIKQAIQIMAHLIATSAPHGTWLAPPRVGKTWATDYCAHRLQEVFPRIPVFRYIASSVQQPTQRNFYVDLMHQFDLGPITRAVSANDARQRVVRAMFAAAQSKSSKKLLFIGDEMQEMNVASFSWLRDVSNELHRLDVRMIAILFGQPELLHLQSSFKHQRRGDIIGRFLSRVYRFDGIRSAAELAQVMEAYDDSEIHEYPQGSGISFTRFFLPMAFAAGWRLSMQAQDAWGQFYKTAKESLTVEDANELSVGMEWVAATLQWVLTQNVDCDSPRFKLKLQDWQEAVAMSGFSSSLPLVYNANPLKPC